MDLVSIILCMCIGNMIAWLMAIYMPRGAYYLLWNVALGSAGALLCGLAMAWAMPSFRVAGLLLGGPLCAIAMVHAGHAARRAVEGRLNPPRKQPL